MSLYMKHRCIIKTYDQVRHVNTFETKHLHFRWVFATVAIIYLNQMYINALYLYWIYVQLMK